MRRPFTRRSRSPSTTLARGAGRCWSAPASVAGVARSGRTGGPGPAGRPRRAARSGRCSAASTATGGRLWSGPPCAARSSASPRAGRAPPVHPRISCATRTRSSSPARACRRTSSSRKWGTRTSPRPRFMCKGSTRVDHRRGARSRSSMMSATAGLRLRGGIASARRAPPSPGGSRLRLRTSMAAARPVLAPLLHLARKKRKSRLMSIRLDLSDLLVGQIEVGLPALAVFRDFPAPCDRRLIP
jgi:hypothetical protein